MKLGPLFIGILGPEVRGRDLLICWVANSTQQPPPAHTQLSLAAYMSLNCDIGHVQETTMMKIRCRGRVHSAIGAQILWHRVVFS